MRVLRTWSTDSEEETIAAGREIAPMLPTPSVVLLLGNLGAGKTTITKGIAQALVGLNPNEVSSPTFTLVHEYTPVLLHIDLYRLESPAELLGLGYDDLLDRRGVMLIEWGDRFPALIPDDHYEIHLTAEGERRHIRLLAPDRHQTG